MIHAQLAVFFADRRDRRKFCVIDIPRQYEEVRLSQEWHWKVGRILAWNPGLSQILCKHRNAVQIEQNIFKAEVAQAAAALFSK